MLNSDLAVLARANSPSITVFDCLGPRPDLRVARADLAVVRRWRVADRLLAAANYAAAIYLSGLRRPDHQELDQGQLPQTPARHVRDAVD